MSWLKKSFSSQSSQETKVYSEVKKDKKEEEKEQVTKYLMERLDRHIILKIILIFQ